MTEAVPITHQPFMEPTMSVMTAPPPAATSTAVVQVETPALTAGELSRRLGVSGDRIRLCPTPGTATAEDAVRLSEQGGGLFELVDGTLVEKAMGWTEGMLAQELGRRLGNNVHDRNRNARVLGADGFSRTGRGRDLLRLPDVGVFLISNFPSGTDFNDIRVADHLADLAVEVLSVGNTAEEMARKRREYFEGGTSIVWIADHRKRTVEVWTGPKSMTLLTDGDTLDGGEILPGFELPVSEWFDSVPKGGVS